MSDRRNQNRVLVNNDRFGQLKSEAKSTGMSMAEIVDKALDDYFKAAQKEA